MISRLGAENFAVLSRQARDYAMTDAGPGLEYNFLFFNLNELGEKAPAEMARKQSWFRSEKFRQAVSLAIDRETIVRLVYQGRGAALWGPVTPGNARWANAAIRYPGHSLDRSRQLLAEAGVRLAHGDNGDPRRFDPDGQPGEVCSITNSSHADRSQMSRLLHC